MRVAEYQLDLASVANPNCPFIEYLDSNDTRCYDLHPKSGYEVISENSIELPWWLSRIDGVGLENLSATATPDIKLPKFIPTIPDGSSSLMQNNSMDIVGVNLGKIISLYHNSKTRNIKDFLDVPSETRVVLFCYGKDKLIEDIWPKREEFYKWVEGLNFDLVTGINYSIWLDQPHAERLINIKRNLITFVEMQNLGIPAIPHLYWSGHADIDRIIDWLNSNSKIRLAALNLQTLKSNTDWQTFIHEFRYFAQKVDPKIHFIISGPSTLSRIITVAGILPNFSYTNTSCALNAFRSHRLVK